mmetsp:Transcript_115279/g.222213  ORF Transcript_115279/g.222213 Transcript_115279/m.222213 type:complete len:248 (+) Transcript_115279:123-866(+)
MEAHTDGRDFYVLLGVSAAATAEDIRHAYRQLALRHHPDKNPDNRAAAEEKFKQLGEAFHVLSDADRRRAYDSRLRAQGTQNGSSAGSHGGGRAPWEANDRPQVDPNAVFQAAFGGPVSGPASGVNAAQVLEAMARGMGNLLSMDEERARKIEKRQKFLAKSDKEEQQRRAAARAHEESINDALLAAALLEEELIQASASAAAVKKAPSKARSSEAVRAPDAAPAVLTTASDADVWDPFADPAECAG